MIGAMRAFRTLVFAVVLVLAPAVSQGENYTTVDNKSVDARLISLKGNMVSLELADGRIIESEISRFSPESSDKIRAQASLIPDVPDNNYELFPKFRWISEAHYILPAETEVMLERELFDVDFFEPGLGVKIYFKNQRTGERMGDPIVVRHEARTGPDEEPLPIKQAANLPFTEKEPNQFTYRAQLEDGSVSTVVVNVEEDNVRFTSFLAKNNGVTENHLVIRTPGMAAQMSNATNGLCAAHIDPTPWETVLEYVKVHQLVFGLNAPGNSIRVGFEEEPVTMPGKFDQVAFAGPGFSNNYVFLETEGDSYLRSTTGEDEELDNIWGGYDLRYSMSALDADPRRESLVIRVIPMK